MTRRMLDRCWQDRRVAVGVVLAVAISYAVVAGWWTPRGPDSTAQALWAMVLGGAVGLVSGAALRSRWAMLLAPATFVAAFELVRLDASGPTVDGISLTSEYGTMAFVVGRLFHGLLTLLPMVVGVAFGRAWARRQTQNEPATRSGLARIGLALSRGALAGATALLLIFAVVLVRPATTDPIRGADGEPLPGSVAELTTVDIGGHDQSLLIRGSDADDPLVLFLAGGPGGSELGAMSRYAAPLEQDFVVVTWDQLGTGRSTGQFDPVATLSFDRAVADTVEVTEYLRDRFDQEQIYLVGNSYGTLLGVRAVQQRPDLYRAFVGTGQMVNVVETDQLFYEDALAHADETGDEALARTLRANGKPPYDDLLDMAPLAASEHQWNDYSGIEGFPGRREPTDNLNVPEYSLMDQVRSMANLLDTYVALYPDLYDVDLRDTTRLDVPVYLVQGAHEARGRAEPAQAWFDRLDAPDKELFVFERSGHRPWVQEPQRFADVMTGTVLARTAPDAPETTEATDPTEATGATETDANETSETDGNETTEANEATEATEVTGSTEATEANEATEATEVTGSTEATEVDGSQTRPTAPEDEADELRNLFADYNPDVWPAHLVAGALGLLVLGLVLRRPGPATDRLVAGVLAALWLWLGVMFFGRYAARLDPLLSAIYGTLFVLQAALFVRAGIVRDRLSFTSASRLAGRVGWASVAYALVVYPLIGVALGHGYPEAPLFGMAPCPTTIATFGLLLLARPPLPRHLLAIPFVWAVLAPLAAVGHGYPEDVGLFVVGVASLVIVLARDRRHRPDRVDGVAHDEPDEPGDVDLDAPTKAAAMEAAPVGRAGAGAGAEPVGPGVLVRRRPVSADRASA